MVIYHIVISILFKKDDVFYNFMNSYYSCQSLNKVHINNMHIILICLFEFWTHVMAFPVHCGFNTVYRECVFENITRWYEILRGYTRFPYPYWV